MTSLPAPVGGEWPLPSLVAGGRVGSGEWAEQVSPLGPLVQRFRQASTQEVERALREVKGLDAALFSSLKARFHAALVSRAEEFAVALRLETGFTESDSREVVESALGFLESTYEPQSAGCSGTYEAGGLRQFRTERVPWGTVVVVLPRNAFLILAVTCAASALAAGNGVVLRSPVACARSAGFLADAVEEAGLARHVSVVLAPAKATVAQALACDEPVLLHYLGSSGHIPDLAASCFSSGKGLIADGEGNGWSYVDSSADVDKAAIHVAEGAVRYSGQTCTSLNGVVVHPGVAEPFKEALEQRWLEIEARGIGPVFEPGQVEACLSSVRESGGRVVSGGEANGLQLAPTLVEHPDADSALVREGVFGPVLWFRIGDDEEFRALWRRNRYPLVAAVYAKECPEWARRLPNLARLTVNGDPSLECAFAPWGGYPSAGINPVGGWMEKYTRVVQIDEPVVST